MNTSSFFELFNHFISSKDVQQMMALTDNVELFSSQLMSDGLLHKGEEAPTAFRNAITRYSKSKKATVLKLEGIIDGTDAGIICTTVKNGRSTKKSAISVVFRDKKFVGFIESEYK